MEGVPRDRLRVTVTASVSWPVGVPGLTEQDGVVLGLRLWLGERLPVAEQDGEPVSEAEYVRVQEPEAVAEGVPDSRGETVAVSVSGPVAVRALTVAVVRVGDCVGDLDVVAIPLTVSVCE